MNSPIYPTVVSTITAFCAAPISLFHTYFQPSPPLKIFDGGAIEITIAARKPGVSPETLQTANGKLLELAQKAPGYHSHYQGVKVEDNNFHVSLVAWQSVEAMEVGVIREN